VNPWDEIDRPGDGTHPDEIQDISEIPDPPPNEADENARILSDAVSPWNNELRALTEIAHLMAPFSVRTRSRMIAWLHDWHQMKAIE
jgi:hypothetical protein